MRLSELKSFVERYQHQLSVGSFLVGFAIDSAVLKRIDLLISNAFLLTYLGIVVVVMLMLHRGASHPPRFEATRRVHLYLPFVAQFAFGGMFSGFLIFYSQSGSLVASWPFMSIIVILIVINEFLRNYQERLTYQSLLLFFCLFSFSIYALPIILGQMGDWVFELSGGAAILAFWGFMSLLYVLDARRVRAASGNIALGTAVVYGLITTLYFANVLPPIPLALKDVGVYHSLVRAGSDYAATEESAPWYSRLSGVTLSLRAGESAFAYSSVFAPTSLSTSIVHRWEKFDDTKPGWVTISTIPFAISGGRDGGYRGYSELGPLEPGRWRVSVETARGQLIGREAFTVVRTTSTVPVVTRILH